MDLSLSEEQQDAHDHLTFLLEREVPLSAVRASEPGGFDAAVWARLVQAGVPGMGAPTECGGGGADLTVLVPAAEALGRALTPAPIVEQIVASRLLAALAPHHPELANVVSGSTLAAFSPRRARNGIAGLVPGGAVADLVLALDGDELVAATGPPPADAPVTFASAPLADRDVSSGQRTVLASGPTAHAAHGRAVDEWKILVAASLVGLSAGALDIAVTYVKTRHQFGVPIGSFQAVQHGLADYPGQIDGARLLVYEAAWSAATGQLTATGGTGPQMASMAFLFVGEVARAVTASCVQYHGGMGYAEEGDPQLFFRRARGWPLVLGDPDEELDRLAGALLESPKAS